MPTSGTERNELPVDFIHEDAFHTMRRVRNETRRPELRGRVVVLNLAGGGFKQPQQVSVLMQMLLLGVPVAAVVNLDGYNELVFGSTNARDGVHPLLPSRFQHCCR